MTIEEVFQAAIERQFPCGQLIDTPTKHGDHWRALVSAFPNGPLFLCAFKERAADTTSEGSP